MADVHALTLQLAQLEARLADLEARQGVHDLIAAFARATDAHCDPALIAPLFTDDAEFDIGDFGTLSGGGAAIAHEMHANNARGFFWTLHYLLSPVIQFSDDRRSASVDFYIFEPAALHQDNGSKAFWVGGRYFAECRASAGRWQFRRLRLQLELMSRHRPGWDPIPAGFDAVLNA